MAPNDEEQIKQAAIAQVAAMFQRPSQLEKLDLVRKRADRKKVCHFPSKFILVCHK